MQIPKSTKSIQKETKDIKVNTFNFLLITTKWHPMTITTFQYPTIEISFEIQNNHHSCPP